MRHTWVAGLFTLTLGLAGCGGESAAAPAASVSSAPAPRDLDLIVMGNEQGEVKNADLYGITFRPLRSYRLTTGKRVDDLSAAGDTVLVAAADQQVDLLGQLGPGGQIVPIPGLGRPHAFGPDLRPNGVIRYEDVEGSGANDERFVEWDPRTKKATVLRTGPSAAVVGMQTGPRGTLFYYDQRPSTAGQIVVIRSGKSISYRIAPRIGAAAVGPNLLAVIVETDDSSHTASGLVLLDPISGKQTPVTGWSPIAWSPDGTKLLVERTGASAGAPSELGLLNPADPTHPRPIGTIPHLTIYQGSWLRGTPAP